MQGRSTNRATRPRLTRPNASEAPEIPPSEPEAAPEGAPQQSPSNDAPTPTEEAPQQPSSFVMTGSMRQRIARAKAEAIRRRNMRQHQEQPPQEQAPPPQGQAQPTHQQAEPLELTSAAPVTPPQGNPTLEVPLVVGSTPIRSAPATVPRMLAESPPPVANEGTMPDVDRMTLGRVQQEAVN